MTIPIKPKKFLTLLSIPFIFSLLVLISQLINHWYWINMYEFETVYSWMIYTLDNSPYTTIMFPIIGTTIYTIILIRKSDGTRTIRM